MKYEVREVRDTESRQVYTHAASGGEDKAAESVEDNDD